MIRKSNYHPEDAFLLEKGKELYDMNVPDSILCSDMHLREDAPKCFIGDWHQEQWKAVELIRSLQQTYKCPVIHAGDLFHYWKPSPALISQALFLLPQKFYTVYGQHDLPQHSLELRHKSGLHTLEVAGKIKVLSECHFGQEPKKISLFFPNRNPDRKVLVWHHMTYITPPFPGAKPDGQAIEILKKYPQFDLIVTGDNHQSFSVKYKGRLLVNPGSMTRQKADQIDFQPRVALWYADTNTIEWVNLPIKENAISREHIDKQDKKQKRIEAFVSSLDIDWEREESFEKNLEIFKNKNRIRKSVLDIINKAIDN